MSKKNFLKNSDVSILNYEISDTVNSKGEESVDVILTIGESEKEFKKHLEKLTESEIKSGFQIHQYEVVLSKKELIFLIKEIEKFEIEGPILED
ncbi:MAG TPA: hypothetical protein DIW37_05380 [Chryseobacterium sp.]|nr:hypothetical protein [Chryseobacterium sp.]